MTSETALTKAEMAFAIRMGFHIEAGKSPIEAAQAVIDDDGRLLSAVADTSHQYQGFGGTSHSFIDSKARLIGSELSRRVYSELRTA